MESEQARVVKGQVIREESGVTLSKFTPTEGTALAVYSRIVRWSRKSEGKPRGLKRFKTHSEALSFFQQKVNASHSAGLTGMSLPPEALIDTAWALDKLEASGASIREAVAFFLESEEAKRQSITVEKAVEDFISFKESNEEEGRQHHRWGLSWRLRAFAKSQPKDKTLAEVTTKDVIEWLNTKTENKRSRTNLRAALSNLFSWGEDHHYCQKNIVAGVKVLKQKRKGKVEIVSPEHLRIILNNTPAELVPAIAIAAFTGIRTAVIERLDWKQIDFEAGEIDVNAEINKTDMDYSVPMCDALKAWLAPHRKGRGKLWVTKQRAKITAFKQSKKLKDVVWESNAMRHSFGSYAFAREEHPERVAMWMGHTSTTLLFKNYRKRVKSEEAALWFGTFPETGEKVVEFKEAG